MKSLRLIIGLTTCAALQMAPASIAQSAASATSTARSTGTIIGLARNAATRKALEGANVTIPQLGLSILSDNAGRFVFGSLPAGTYELTISYIGLDVLKSSIVLAAGERIAREFELNSGIYQLDAFKVTGEREGNALALTMQRNAENVKNVVAMDSYGVLPNASVGEVFIRLPGVAPVSHPEGLNYAVIIRGMPPGLNTVTMDGQRMPSIGTNRALELHSLSSSLYEQVELIKGLTPDASADSIGGALNLKSRSTLDLKEKRSISFSSNLRAALPVTEQIPLREAHRYHGLFTFSYKEHFDILGGQKNFGVQANIFYSENVIGGIQVTNDYQATTAAAPYVWNYSYNNNFNNRMQRSANIKTEYRLSDTSRFVVTTLFNHNIERMRRGYTMRAYTGNATSVPSDTSIATGINPGWTATMTSVRPLTTANYLSNTTNTTAVDVGNTGPNSYIVRQWLASFAADHTWGPIKLDYNTGYSRNNLKTGMTNGGATGGQYGLTQRIANVGWTIKPSSSSNPYPIFTQTAGPSIADPNNYRPIVGGLAASPQNLDQYNKHFTADLIYNLPTKTLITFKTGFTWRELAIDTQNFSRRWDYRGTSALPTNPTIQLYKGGGNTFAAGMTMPVWQVSEFMTGRAPTNPALWSEDMYFFHQNGYTGNRGVIETITAAYGMFKGKFGSEGWLKRTGFLAGVRQEKTETESYGWVKTKGSAASTVAQQVADPLGSARRDYEGFKRNLTGSYTKAFPSVHLNHDITPNLKARLSWSTGFGRAAPGNLMPGESANETLQTVTVNNPALLPQMATNWDATLEYYFEPMGTISAGWFSKKITDYIVSGLDNGIVATGNTNGFNGEYGGYRLLTTKNAGTASVAGWEFSYQQQFVFLPGLLKGLGAMVNYTQIETEGDFGLGTGISRKSNEVPSFIPKVSNAMITWNHRGFRARVLVNYHSNYITSFSATNAGLNVYRFSRSTVDFGISQQISKTLSFTFDIGNIFKAPQEYYTYQPERFQSYVQNYITITTGISGRF
ncbi:MAG: TonB-dependent receptor [Opitutus sp.]|nr:TonB-dependent receptor [Opitutus sp.]